MFDWDRDFDETVRGRKITPQAEAPTSERPDRAGTAPRSRYAGQPRTRRLPVFMALLALVPVGAGAVSLLPGMGFPGLDGTTSTTTQGAASGATAGLTALLSENASSVRPQPQPLPPMQVYGQRQIAAFQHGIARYADTELQRWSAQLAQDLDADRPVRFLAHHKDLLALTLHELARRGLAAAP